MLNATATIYDDYDNFFSRVSSLNEVLEKGTDVYSMSFDPTVLSPQIIKAAYAKLLNNAHIQKSCKELKPGTGIYIKRSRNSRKKHGSYDRSIAIIREPGGEYRLIIEPKSKLPDNNKRWIKWPSGAKKIWRVCYRADVPTFDIMASGVIRRDFYKRHTKHGHKGLEIYDQELRGIIKDYQYSNHMYTVSQSLYSPVVLIPDTVVDSARRSRGQLRVYSEYGGRELFEIIVTSGGGDILDRDRQKFECVDKETGIETFKQVSNWRLDIIYQLIQALAALEREGLNHYDLKPENILCIFDAQRQGYNVKVIDFAGARFDEEHILAGTEAYESPEFYLQELREAVNKGLINQPDWLPTFYNKYKERSLGLYVLMHQVIGLQKKDGTLPTLSDSAYRGRTDIWSLGLIISSLLTGKDSLDIFASIRPSEKSIDLSNALDKATYYILPGFPLAEMLEPEPDKRVSASTLLERVDRMPQFDSAREKFIAYSSPSLLSTPTGINNLLDDLLKPMTLWFSAVRPEGDQPKVLSILKKCAEKMYITDLNRPLEKYASIDYFRFKNFLKNIDILLNPYTKPAQRISVVREIQQQLEKYTDLHQRLWSTDASVYPNNKYDEAAWVEKEAAKAIFTIAYNLAKISLARFDASITPNQKMQRIQDIFINMREEFNASVAPVIHTREHGLFRDRYGLRS